MNRKDPRNFGSQLQSEQPEAPTGYRPAAGRYSIAQPERAVLALLREEVARLVEPKNAQLVRQFFEHFFLPLVSDDEIDSYVQSFLREPPQTLLGYPRTSVTLPCMAVVLEQDEETQEALGQYLGETQAGEPEDDSREFLGTMFDVTLGVFIYATHPDQALYLYHLAKAILIGGTNELQQLGLIDPGFSGSELQPQPEYMPTNVFVRRLSVSCKALFTVPSFLAPDPARVRLGGIFAHDVVVSGLRGGVKVEGEDGC